MSPPPPPPPPPPACAELVRVSLGRGCTRSLLPDVETNQFVSTVKESLIFDNYAPGFIAISTMTSLFRDSKVTAFKNRCWCRYSFAFVHMLNLAKTCRDASWNLVTILFHLSKFTLHFSLRHSPIADPRVSCQCWIISGLLRTLKEAKILS